MDAATSKANEQIRLLADDIYWDKVRRAREQPPIEKLRAGFSLYESACRITLAGIRNQHVGVTDEEALRILKERVEMKRRWDEVK